MYVTIITVTVTVAIAGLYSAYTPHIQHSIHHIIHVQSVYIFRYKPVMFGSLFVIIISLGPLVLGEISQINSSQQVYI